MFMVESNNEKLNFFGIRKGSLVLLANFPILCLKPQTENFPIFNGNFSKLLYNFTIFKTLENCCSTLLFVRGGVMFCCWKHKEEVEC